MNGAASACRQAGGLLGTGPSSNTWMSFSLLCFTHGKLLFGLGVIKEGNLEIFSLACHCGIFLWEKRLAIKEA